MADPVLSVAKPKWHFWVIGVVALLWNAIGALDFAMTQTRNEAYLGEFTPEQREYFFSFPMWVVISWGVATWGSLIASTLFLMRRRAAVPVYLVSIIGMVLTTIHNFVLSDGMAVMCSDGIGPLIFSAVIWVVAILLYVYSRAMRKRGVLR